MYIGEVFGLFSVPLSRASFCVTLLRLTVVPWQRKLLWSIIITVQLTFYSTAVMTLVQCDPIHKLWDMTLPGKCWDNRIVIYYSMFVGCKQSLFSTAPSQPPTITAYSSLMDFLLAICPWLIIHKLQMRRREKWGIILAMSLGCL
jgi:hypothetical protein